MHTPEPACRSIRDGFGSRIDVKKRGSLRRLIAFVGPAYLVSVGYMDPGNWATDIEGGARFGYMLIWGCCCGPADPVHPVGHRHRSGSCPGLPTGISSPAQSFPLGVKSRGAMIRLEVHRLRWIDGLLSKA
jgi:hypothetical protein